MTYGPPLDLLNAGSAGTLWGNLGDWSRARSYPDAAEALAVRLGQAADLAGGQHVLDAGTGAGDQLRVWIERFGVERVTAVERDPARAATARALAEAGGWASRAEVLVADAARLRLDPGSVDRVVSLDAAYFFRSRADFLTGAFHALRPGGRLALADLVLGSGLAGFFARALAPAFHVPRPNLLTRAGWVASLESVGFRDVRVDECTDAVLGGFARWSRSRWSGGRAAVEDGADAARAVRVVGRVGGALARSGALGYAVVTACKAPASSGGAPDRPGPS